MPVPEEKALQSSKFGKLFWLGGSPHTIKRYKGCEKTQNKQTYFTQHQTNCFNFKICFSYLPVFFQCAYQHPKILKIPQNTLQYVLSRSVVYDSLQPFGLEPARLPVHGILQARILECTVISFSRGQYVLQLTHAKQRRYNRCFQQVSSSIQNKTNKRIVAIVKKKKMWK